MATKKSTTPSEVTVSEILKINTGSVVCNILGTTPLVFNRLSNKVQRELLMPRGRKSAGERATTLKHDPYQEFRDSVHKLGGEDGPTFLAMPSTAFKGALRSAALDIPGAKKAQIGRLTWVEGENVAIYGVPKLFMRPVRSADMNRTPDIRTRAILPTWACQVRVTFVEPLIRLQAVVNLLNASGLIVGVGDGRNEKGALTYGQFRIVQPEDKEFQAIVKVGGREPQIAAMEAAVCYDDESTELLSWFVGELAQRKLKGVA